VDADAVGEATAGLDAEREMERKLEELEAKIQSKLDEVKRATEQEEAFDPEFLLYEPSTGTNSRVTLRQLIDRKVAKNQLGGWTHIMWAIMPKP
jgi:NMD protein affecting ribosome stability and mRNA decay